MSTASLMTFAEFERLPDKPGKHELIGGELLFIPPADKKHSILSQRIAQLLLHSHLADRVRVDGTGYRIGSGWLVPDASVLWPGQPEDDKYYLTSPLLAVEILSKDEDIERKLTLYFAEGALEVWVIDPRHQAMTVYSRRQDMTVTRTPVEHEYTSFEDLTVRLDDLFAGF